MSPRQHPTQTSDSIFGCCQLFGTVLNCQRSSISIVNDSLQLQQQPRMTLLTVTISQGTLSLMKSISASKIVINTSSPITGWVNWGKLSWQKKTQLKRAIPNWFCREELVGWELENTHDEVISPLHRETWQKPSWSTWGVQLGKKTRRNNFPVVGGCQHKNPFNECDYKWYNRKGSWPEEFTVVW